jgi:hypothetical protein
MPQRRVDALKLAAAFKAALEHMNVIHRRESSRRALAQMEEESGSRGQQQQQDYAPESSLV